VWAHVVSYTMCWVDTYRVRSDGRAIRVRLSRDGCRSAYIYGRQLCRSLLLVSGFELSILILRVFSSVIAIAYEPSLGSGIRKLIERKSRVRTLRRLRERTIVRLAVSHVIAYTATWTGDAPEWT